MGRELGLEEGSIEICTRKTETGGENWVFRSEEAAPGDGEEAGEIPLQLHKRKRTLLLGSKGERRSN